MKWIKLSEREPIPDGKPIIIKIYDGDNILDVFWVTNHIGLVEDWSRYEWLDESQEDIITFKAIDQFDREVRTQVYIDQEGNVYRDADPHGVDMSGKRTIYGDSKIKIFKT